MSPLIAKRKSGNIYDLGAAVIARSIREGRLSAARVVEGYIDRIQEVNESLNAVVYTCFDRARKEAEQADAALRRGDDVGPLHGVPFTVKECFQVEGAPTTLGVRGRRNTCSTEDSLLVGAMRRAGAILLGKTNLSQLMMWHESDNPLFGRTNNPWNTGRTCGGSTGGEAALLASGGTPLGLGTDIGGSIRVPSHFCGVAGLKPTARLLSLSGVEHPFDDIRCILFQSGPMARNVEDLDLTMRTLSDDPAHRRAPDTAQATYGDMQSVQLQGLKIAYSLDDGFVSPSPAIRRRVQEAADFLRSQGAVVEQFEMPPPEHTADHPTRLYMALFGAAGGANMAQYLNGEKVDSRLKRIRWLSSVSGGARRLGASLLRYSGQRRFGDLMAKTGPLMGSRLDELEEECTSFVREFRQELFQRRGFDVWLTPPHATPAFRHGYGVEMLLAASYTYLPNILNLPAGVVPAGTVQPGEESDRKLSFDITDIAAWRTERGSAGLPIGVQVAARPFHDHVVLAVMQALETHFRAGD